MKLKTARKWFDKICFVLNECELKIQQQPRVSREYVDGHCNGETIAVKNNPDTNNIELTLIHEALHYLRPKWNEKKIEKKSMQILAGFTTNHLKALRQYVRRK